MSDITAKKKSNKKLIFIIAGIVLAVVILIIVGISIITSKISGMLPAVEVAHPLQTDISSSVTTSGTITSGDVTSYTTSVTATVSDVTVKPGQAVKAGDPLLTFDTASLEEQYNEASLNAPAS